MRGSSVSYLMMVEEADSELGFGWVVGLPILVVVVGLRVGDLGVELRVVEPGPQLELAVRAGFGGLRVGIGGWRFGCLVLPPFFTGGVCFSNYSN